jgi:hypothetical protein
VQTRAHWVWALLAVGACSGKFGRAGCGIGGSRAATDGEAACQKWATQLCGRLDACAPVSVDVDYGDVAACIARNVPPCVSSLAANGTGRTLASVLACAASYDTASCDDVVVGRPPPSCRVPGTLPGGARCGDDAQCAGPQSYCRIAPDATCGTCAALGESGAPCASDRDCESGLVCYFSCMAPVGLHEPCDGMTRQCPQTLVCLDYECVAPAALGAPCEPRADPCDHDHGLFCDPRARVCARYATADARAACGGGAICRNGTCGTDEGTEATCVPNASDGMSCDPAGGPSCIAPARCVGAKCRMPEPARCM